MPSTSTPTGHHPIPSTDPPETAKQLGLTGQQPAAAEPVEPPPPAEVSPPPRAPLFGSSRRRHRATPDPAGEDWPPVSETSASDGPRSTTPPTESSSPGSTDPGDIGEARRIPTADPRPLRESAELTAGIAQGIHAIGDELNDRLAPGTDMFLTDPQDEQGLAKPVGRLILRKMPAERGAAGNPDLVDVIAAAIVLVRYGVKQLNLASAYRRARRQAEANGQVPMGTPPAEPQPAAA